MLLLGCTCLGPMRSGPLVTNSHPPSDAKVLHEPHCQWRSQPSLPLGHLRGIGKGQLGDWKKHRYPNQFFTHGANILFQTSASCIDGKIYQIDRMLLSNISQDNIFSTVRATQISMRSMRTKSQDKDCSSSMYVTCFHDPQRVAWFIAASGIHVKTFWCEVLTKQEWIIQNFQWLFRLFVGDSCKLKRISQHGTPFDKKG